MFTVGVKQQHNTSSTRHFSPGRVAQSVGHLTRKFWVRYPVWPHTFVSPSADSRSLVVSYWRKYVHEVLVNRLGGLSLPRKSVGRLTDRPDMTVKQQHNTSSTRYFSIQHIGKNPDPNHVFALPFLISATPCFVLCFFFCRLYKGK